MKFLIYFSLASCPVQTRLRQEGEGAMQITGARICLIRFFIYLDSVIIFRLYKLTVSDKTQVTLNLTVSLSDLVSRILAGPPLLGVGWGGPKKFLHRSPNPLSAALLLPPLPS